MPSNERHSGRFDPASLPCLLVTGLFVLLCGKRETLGFSSVGLSVLLYLTFLFVEDALSLEHMDRGEWVFNGIWIVLCTVAIVAAWLLKRRFATDV